MGEAYRRRPVLELLAEISVVLVAVWTVYCNLLVWAGASFETLAAFALVPPVLAALMVWVSPRLSRLKISPPVHESESIRGATWPRVPGWSQMVVAAVVVCAYFVTGSYLLFWMLAASFLGVSFYLEKAQRGVSQDPDAPPSRAQTVAVLGVGIVAAAITLATHRPNTDDAFYLNVAVTALDFQTEPLLQRDGMHGVLDLPLLLSVYRVHSFELLNAALAHLTSLAPISVYYLLLPALFAMMMVIAHWLALRRLLPQAALISLLFVLVIMLAWGDRQRSYANFGLVRLFQGKAVLFSVMVPLAFHYAIRYVECRDLRSFLLLCLVQIAGIGCSSSGLLSITVTVFLVLLAGWRANWPQTKLIAAGLLSAGYPVLVGLWVMADVVASGGLSVKSITSEAAVSTTRVFGDGGRAFCGFFAIIAFPFVTAREHRKLLLGFAFLTIALLFSPWTSKLFAAAVSSNMSWRIYWAVPVPLLVALTFGGVVLKLTSRWRSRAVRAIASLLLGIIYCALPGTWTLSPDNGTRLAPPGYKVPEQYSVAEEVIRVTPPRGSVLASADVSPWIPIHRKHPYPIVVRRTFLRNLSDGMGREEAQLRGRMLSFLSENDLREETLALVVREIESRRIDTIAFSTQHARRAEFVSELERLGYTGRTFGEHDVWTANWTTR